jgi:hypothetical protein
MGRATRAARGGNLGNSGPDRSPFPSAPLVGRLQLGAHARAGREAVAGVLLPQLGHEPLPEARSARLHEPG